MELARAVSDLACGLCDQLLAPAVMNRPEQPYEQRGRRDQHLLLDSELDQRRICRHRRLVDAVGGNEHDNELGRHIDLTVIALRGELADVISRLFGMTRDVALT